MTFRMAAMLRPGSALLLGSLLSACHPNTASTDAQTAEVPALRRQGNVIEVPQGSPLLAKLQVEAVTTAELSTPVSAPASIEAAPEKLVKLAPPVAGRLVQIHRALGDAVRAGDPLFTMDSADMANVRADQAKAQATLLHAQREADRQKLLLDAEIAARKDYEAAELELATARADVAAVADQLAQMGAPSKAGSRGAYVLRSPINGRVVEMNGAQGAYWNDINESVMTVADLSTVWLSASVNERDLASVTVGQNTHISLNAYPNQTLEGKVRYVGELLDPETRSVKVRVAVDNQDGRLRPGMFAQVRFDGPVHQATVVPTSALLQSGVGTRVFVEQSAGHFVPREVQVGAQQGQQVEITDGLKAGERVVVNGGVLLHD
ncbi:efflux RND transporter periplasmic adaptor subunit [Comamonas sp. GB3 AK4-5]|uniref:efflux RND transporter periplasmic adaptor subunit n=1 Tax=Comamonas sp. GB3 AK4-5 TaxID=3231487 RepID=UPI00351F13EF